MALHGGQSSLVLHPTQGEERGVHAKHGGRVEHGFAINVGLVVEHARNGASRLAQNVLLHCNQRSPCRTQILLSARIDEVKLRKVQLAAKNIRGHVAHKAGSCGGEVLHLRAKNGVVACAMEVIQLLTYGVALGDVAKVFVGRGP